MTALPHTSPLDVHTFMQDLEAALALPVVVPTPLMARLAPKSVMLCLKDEVDGFDAPPMLPQFSTAPMDAAWKKAFDANADLDSLPVGLDPWFTPAQRATVAAAKKRMVHRLLSWGGERVCVPAFDHDLPLYFTRGLLLPHTRLTVAKGAHNACHANSAALWRATNGRLLVMTGYALSPDGMWRQHSWCVEPPGHWNNHALAVIETTVARTAYFGYALTSDEARVFAAQNIDFD